MPGMNNVGQYGIPTYGYPQPAQPYPVQQGLVYVHGIEGANAYQLPVGVMKQILWDDTVDSFYIKALDEMGRPKVVAWKDFADHVIPQAPEVQKGSENTLDMSMYMTKADFEQILSQLYVGERGRIMRNELNA